MLTHINSNVAPSVNPFDAKHELVRPQSAGRCIVVMGVTACGKSTTARLIGGELRDFSHVDADPLHPPRNQEKIDTGIPLTAEERAIFVARLLGEVQARTGAGENLVLSWSALRKEHRAALLAILPQAVFIYLPVPEAVAQRRAEERRAADPKQPHPGIVRDQFAALEVPQDAIHISGELEPLEIAHRALGKLWEQSAVTLDDFLFVPAAF